MHSSLKNIDLAVYNVNKYLKSVRHWFCRNDLICNTKKLESHDYCVPQSTQNQPRH